MFGIARQLREEADCFIREITWTNWKKHYCLLPRKINGERHWLCSVYKRYNLMTRKTHYGTIADVMVSSE